MGRALAGGAVLAAVWMVPEAAQAGDGGLVGGLVGAVSPATDPVLDPVRDTVEQTVDTLDPSGTVGTAVGSVGDTAAGVVGHATSPLAGHPGAEPDAATTPGTKTRGEPAHVADPVSQVRHVAQPSPAVAAHDSGSPPPQQKAATPAVKSSVPAAKRRPTQLARAGQVGPSDAPRLEAAPSQRAREQLAATTSPVAPDICWTPGLPAADLRSCLDGRGLPDLGGPRMILLPIGLALIGVGLTVALRSRSAR